MKQPIKVHQSDRKFAFAEFTDLYGSQCSMSESSLATDEAIWLGVDTDFNGRVCTRMHLNREQVAELLPILERFVKTGSIMEESND